VEVFNCSLQFQLTFEKSKSLALECQLNIEQKQQVEAEEAVVEEQKKVKRLCNQVLYYKTSLSSALAKKNAIVTDGDKSSFDSLVDQIKNAFGIMKGAHPSMKAAKLLEIISAGLLFNGEGISILEGMHRDYIRNNFLPWKLVYASDMSLAGSFRTATVTGLSEFFDEPESDNVTEAKKKRIFPSASKVSRERQALNRYTISRVGLTRRSSPYGEIYHLDPERVIQLLLKAAGLTEIAQREPVHIAVTSDGANGFHNRTQISIGIKIVDTRGHHCKTKLPIFVRNEENDPEDISGFFQGVQSSEMCTSCIMADAPDKSKMYSELFSDFYKYTEGFQSNGIPASDHGPRLHPMKVSYPSDLKAMWTTSGRGGNCKKSHFFCHLCSAMHHDLTTWKEGSLQCSTCKQRSKVKCYHHQVCDSTTVEALLADLEVSLDDYLRKYGKHYEEVMSKSNLQYDHTEFHIDYVIPENDPQKKINVHHLLQKSAFCMVFPSTYRMELKSGRFFFVTVLP
jgi:hypothetical protein